MKVLDLRLQGVYYDLIKAGKKTHEYRKLDDYYVGRLIGGIDMRGLSDEQKKEVIDNLRDPSERKEYMKSKGLYYRVGSNPGAYTHIRFRRGAVNTFMLVEIEDMVINAGQFDITLGKVSEQSGQVAEK